MGFIKGSLLSLAVLLLFFSLLLGNLFITLNLSLSNQTLKESISSNFDEIVRSFGGESAAVKDAIRERLDEMKAYCDEGNKTEFVFSQGGYRIEVPCSAVSEGEDAVVKEGISNVIDGIYYAEYSCSSPLRCISEEKPLFFFSQQAKDYFGGKTYYLIAISALLIAVMFFLVESKENLLIITGTLAIISSLPFMAMEKIFSIFDYSYLKIIPIILSKSYSVFIVVVSVGIILLALGLVFKFFNLGKFVMEKLGKKQGKKKVEK